MSNCHVNIRFGYYHFQITKYPLEIRWAKNNYWVENKPTSWFEIYEFFGFIKD